MDVKAAILARRSVRKYEKREIPAEVLEQLLEVARRAPSSSNKQKFHIVVVMDEELKSRLVPVCGDQKFVGDCSAFLAGVTDAGADYHAIDITIALDHLSLRAVELGLGTCWIGDFEPQRLKEILGVPVDKEIQICMTLGYPKAVPEARTRKKLADLFHRDRWGVHWGAK